ncbi:MAG: hypothetical protein RL563_2011 [Pseudomonadota bacterium]
MKLYLGKVLHWFLTLVVTIESWLPWLFGVVFILFVGFMTYQDYQRDLEQRKIEEPTWKVALEQKNVQAYFDYLRGCSLCEHHEEAESMLSSFQKTSGLLVDLNINHLAMKHPKSVRAADISPDVRKLASANSSSLWVWETETGEHWHPNNQAFIGCGIHPEQVVFSQDGDFLVSVDQSGMACLWDAQSGRLKTSQQLVDGDVKKLAISSHGDYLAWYAFAQNPGFWNRLNGSMHFLDHEDVDDLVFDNQDFLLTGSSNRIARWDTNSGDLLGQVAFDEEGFFMGFSGNGRYGYFVVDTKLVIRDAINGEVKFTIDNPAELSAICSGRYSNTLVTATKDGDLLLWDAGTGRRLTALKAHPKGIDFVVCSATGDRILTVGGYYSHAKLWNVTAMTGSPTGLQ